MSTNVTKRERRRLRKQQEQSAREQERLKRRIRLILFSTVVILMLIVLGPRLWKLSIGQAQIGTPVPLQGNEHVPSVDTPHPPYNSVPPTSGWHVPTLAPWGVQKSPIPNELQVHNLEDGGVMVQYNCSDCDEEIARMEALARRFKRVIVAPYPDMPHRIAVTAWGRILTLEQYDEEKIVRFIKAYEGIDHHPGAQR